MLTVKEFKKGFCILFISKHAKNIINITFIYENLSFVKFLQPFLLVIAHEQIGKDRTKEIPLIPDKLDHKVTIENEMSTCVAKLKSCVNSRFVTFNCGLF